MSQNALHPPVRDRQGQAGTVRDRQGKAGTGRDSQGCSDSAGLKQWVFLSLFLKKVVELAKLNLLHNRTLRMMLRFNLHFPLCLKCFRDISA